MAFMSPGAVLVEYIVGRCSTPFRQALASCVLPFTDWAGFGRYVGHDLPSCSIGIKLFGYHKVVLDARECDKATC
jgi:hypothetical protein